MSVPKVIQVKAFKSEDGCIWETEAEAIENNIDNCLPNVTYAERDVVKKWFKQSKHSVRYILANIDKIELKDE